jgi:hypothetical protein
MTWYLLKISWVFIENHEVQPFELPLKPPGKEKEKSANL